MSVKPHLQTSLSQRLVLTPQMRQRIEMLQMTKLELSDMILGELEQNPVLDEAEPGATEEQIEELPAEQRADEPVAREAAPEAGEPPAQTDAQVEAETDLGSDVEERDPFEEIDFGQTFEEYLDPGYK